MDLFVYFHKVILCSQSSMVESQLAFRIEVLQVDTNLLIFRDLIFLAFLERDMQETHKNFWPFDYLVLPPLITQNQSIMHVLSSQKLYYLVLNLYK